MNPFEMVVLIVAITMVATVLKAKYRSDHGGGRKLAESANAENQRLRQEIATLKDRVAVLERLATEDSGPRALEREIEKLRSPDV
jgi:uncharacterized protein YlxW (UPF0749 family)